MEGVGSLRWLRLVNGMNKYNPTALLQNRRIRPERKPFANHIPYAQVSRPTAKRRTNEIASYGTKETRHHG